MPALRTSTQDLIALFRALGLRSGQDVLFHSALYTLGRIENGVAGFHAAAREVLGPEATIIAPTFTYSFRRGEVFDIRNTPAPAILGVFPEHIRRLGGAVRSACPLFSFVAEGPRAADLMRRPSVNCFGPGSVYERLFAANVRIAAIGITYSTGVSGFLHLEKLAGVDYRIDRRFSGTSVDLDGLAFADEAVHFARHEARYPNGRTDREPMGRELEEAGISTAAAYGSGRHMAFDAAPFAAFVTDRLRGEPRMMFRPQG